MGGNKRTDEEIQWIVNIGQSMTKPSSSIEWLDYVETYNNTFAREIMATTLSRLYREYKYYNESDDFIMSKMKQHRNMQTRNSKIVKENRIVLDTELTRDTFLQTFEDLLKKSPIIYHPKTRLKKSKVKTERIVVGHISDTHVGAEIDPEELGGINCYSYIEEARRHAFYFKQLAEYKTQYRNETELVLFLNGDLMQGVIHDQEDAAEMTTQFARALNIYVQGITYVAQFYKSVRIICTTGNHGRFMHKSNKGRVVSKKWDGFHTMLNIGIRTALRQYKNINIEIPVTPYASVDILGHHFFVVHGDTVLSVGNVSKSINVSSIASQVNDINSALDRKVQVLLVGHVHKATYQALDNGTDLLINGCLSGTDPFAQSIGILHNHPIQQMFECTRQHAVGDIRFVRLKDADKDEKLDKIIKPLSGKF